MKSEEKIEIKDVPVENKSSNIIEWEAPEHEHFEKGVSWYWISLIISILLIGFALWNKNFLFAVFIVIAELLLLNFGNEEPKIWSFFIRDEEIGIGRRKSYKFKDIISYDIHPSSDEFNELVFKTTKKATPMERILIHIDDTDIIDQRLSQKLKKEEIPPSLLDILAKILRF